jgi:lipoyl(octanoyl) transferase
VTTGTGWHWLASGPGDPAFNMGLDEALLEAMPRLKYPILRFYGWTQPATSFGYFQKYAEIQRLTTLRPLVRRPTGGGLVPHDADWTYSLVFPTSHEWYFLAATESYRRIHLWIQTAFKRLGVETELAPAANKNVVGQCFIGHEQCDLLWRGRKIAGAAQRRRKDGLLIQGSIQPPSNAIARPAWEQAMREAASFVHGLIWKEYGLDAPVQEKAIELATTKYSQPSYTQRR